MNYGNWILDLLLALPLVVALIILLGPAAAAKRVALIGTLLEFACSVPLWWMFETGTAAMQFGISHAWIPGWGVTFTLGLDGISLFMVLLTTFTMPLAVLGSWNYIKERERAYYALLLVLTTGMLGVFEAKITRLGLGNVRTQFCDLAGGDTLSGRYDLVVSAMTLHHVKDIEPLFDEFARITAPGGRLCIADLDPDDGEFHDDNTGVFHFGFARAALREVFEQAGFEHVEATDAAEMVKPGRNGEARRFTVFLMTGTRRAVGG